ncbi:MAG: asparagine synthetase B [Chitinophagales bacterium]|nr:MAG: asparagine synthetase B [Chitinophagales bacterium]
MCGIAGFYSPDLLFTEEHLQQMTSTLRHRGPDACGFYYNGKTGLGHRRLSIIDLSEAANQPMYSHSGRYLVVFNGEIYNFRDLAAGLGIRTRTHSDTEIIAEGFERLRENIAHKLNGMFAIAVYDVQEDALFLFRDRLGKKPLFYFWDGKNFAFASEIKALMMLPQIRQQKAISKTALNHYLYLGYVPEPHTIYAHIKKFPAGSYARLKSQGLHITSFWKPEHHIRAEVISDELTAKSKLNELLVSSVQYRMISDVPYGAFLSGGTDSSLVTAIAQRNSAEPINTFSIGFKEAKFNEAPYARQIAKYLGTHHHEFTVSQNDALEYVDMLPEIYDEPFADSSALPTLLVSRLARQHVKMVLTGDGGDELYMGYGFYRWARRLRHPLIRALRKPAAMALGRLSSRYQRAAHLFRYPHENKLQSHIFSQEQYNYSETEIQHLVQPAYYQPLEPDTLRSDLPRNLTAAESQALFDLSHYLKDDLLVKVDRASMHFSLEARVPLLDYRLVEFALNVDERLKLRGPVMKYLLKQALYDYVPEKFFAGRPKWGFAIPLATWLKNELKYLVDTYLNETVTHEIGLLRPDVVSELVRRFYAGTDYLYNRLWIIIVLHLWYKKSFETTAA